MTAQLSLAFGSGILVGWVSMALALAGVLPRRRPEGLAPDAAGPVRATLARKGE